MTPHGPVGSDSPQASEEAFPTALTLLFLRQPVHQSGDVNAGVIAEVSADGRVRFQNARSVPELERALNMTIDILETSRRVAPQNVDAPSLFFLKPLCGDGFRVRFPTAFGE